MECVVSHGLTLSIKAVVTWLKKRTLVGKIITMVVILYGFSEFGQSVTRKENYARAFVVLGDNGITVIYNMSRLD